MQANEYVLNAIRTKSDQFHGELVPLHVSAGWLENFLEVSRPLDMVKKGLFYGKVGDKIPGLLKDGEVPTNVKPEVIDLLHGILGIITEADELLGPFVRVMADEGQLDKVNVMEECGDVLWYVAIILNSIGYTMEECMDRNIEKLCARFPEKFTEDAANNRDLDKERQVLEGQ